MNRNYLFSTADIFAVIETQKNALKERVRGIPAEKLLNASEHDLVQALVEEARLDVPAIIEEGICIESAEEKQIDVSRDPMRIIYDRSKPFYITVNETVISVPFKGDGDFFKVRPNRFGGSPSQAQVRGNALQLTYVRTDHDAEAIKRAYQTTATDIKEYLGWLSEAVIRITRNSKP